MSLNDIKLHPQLLASLYPEILIETEIGQDIQLNTDTQLNKHAKQDPIQEKIVRVVQPQKTVMEIEPAAPTIEEADVQLDTSITKKAGVPADIPKKEEPNKAFDFLGKNEKRILILVYSSKAHYLPEPELKFLESILNACRFTTKDVAILNTANQHTEHTSLQSFFQNKAALLFGIEPLKIDLPMNFPQFQLQSFNKCTYLHAPALSEIEKQRELKMKLWGCLKNLFSL